MVVSRMPWSWSTSRVSPVGVPSSPSTGASMGRISRLKRPSSRACLARCWERSPSPSACSRVIPRLAAMRSTAVNWESGSSQGNSGGMKKPGPFITLAPSPTWLMSSIPQAMPTSMVPPFTRAFTMWFACWPEPHWTSTVVPAVE